MRAPRLAVAGLAALAALVSVSAGCVRRGRWRTAESPLTAPTWEEKAPEWLRQATVAFEIDGQAFCTGALAVRPDLVVTAFHCLSPWSTPKDTSHVRLSDGSRREASLIAYDEHADLVLLRLQEPAALEPLPVADSDALHGGETLYFLGMPDPHRRVQRARVRARDACPDLPGVPDAVFASHIGKPGDSGAALVGRGGIVAIVHGGTHCNIAIPSSALGPLLDQALAQNQEP